MPKIKSEGMLGHSVMTSVKKCIYCGSSDNITDDHVPPKNLFPKPRPSNLITVPSCKQCNSSFSKDDEYFRSMLVSCEPVHDDENAKKIFESVLRSLRRSEAKGFNKQIQESLSSIDIMSPGGIFLKKAPAIKFDAKRIKSTATRIAKGLFYVITGQSFSESYEISVAFQDGYLQPPKGFIQEFQGYWITPITIGDNVFTYTYAQSNEDSNAMVFLYVFYSKLYFFGVIVPSKELRTNEKDTKE